MVTGLIPVPLNPSGRLTEGHAPGRFAASLAFSFYAQLFY
jgi:hypothetical protein